MGGCSGSCPPKIPPKGLGQQVHMRMGMSTEDPSATSQAQPMTISSPRGINNVSIRSQHRTTHTTPLAPVAPRRRLPSVLSRQLAHSPSLRRHRPAACRVTVSFSFPLGVSLSLSLCVNPPLFFDIPWLQSPSDPTPPLVTYPLEPELRFHLINRDPPALAHRYLPSSASILVLH